MIARTLALLHRALRIDARMLRTHMFRAALIGLVIYELVNVRHSPMGAPGLQFFSWLQFYNFWFITFAGATFFATCITEEKEELTLGLLKLAGVSPPALLLGKWMPRLLGALFLLSVQFPFMLLAITLGGILMDQALASYCALAAHLLLVGAVGLFASVVCRKTTGACVLAGCVIGAYIIGPYLVGFTAEALADFNVIPTAAGDAIEAGCEWVVETSALQRLDVIMMTGFTEPPLGLQVQVNVIAACVFFAAAWLLFNPCTSNELASVEAGGGWWLRLVRLGQRGSQRAWSWPLLWKDFRMISGGVPVVIVKFLGYGMLIGAVTFLFFAGTRGWGSFDLREALAGVMLWTMFLVILLETAVIAARVFRAETKAQTWPGLVLLPRTLPEVAYGKVAGSLLGLIPAVVYFVAGLLINPEILEGFLEHVVFDGDGFFGLTYFLTQVALFLHVTTLLSISWSWGAWPVSIFFAGFTVIMGNVMLITCLEATLSGPSSEGAVFFIFTFVGASLVLVVHLWIGQRLSRLAAA